MPHLVVHLSNDGPMIDVLFGITEARAVAVSKQRQLLPEPVPIRALIDTGASCSVIDLSVASALDLAPTGTTSMFTPSTGTTAHNAYQYDVSLTCTVGDNIPHKIQPLAVVGSDLTGRPFKALIGRDVLQNSLFIVDGPSQMITLSF